jgi:hypothetical protein
MEDRYKKVAYGADILDIDDDPVRGSLGNVHSIDGFTRKVVGLFKVDHLAFLDLIGRKVFAALTRLQARQSVRVHDQCLPLLVSR